MSLMFYHNGKTGRFTFECNSLRSYFCIRNVEFLFLPRIK